MEITNLLKEKAERFLDLDKVKVSSRQRFSKHFPHKEETYYDVDLVISRKPDEVFYLGSQVSILTKSFLQTSYKRSRWFAGETLTALLESLTDENTKEELKEVFRELAYLNFYLKSTDDFYLSELRKKFKLCLCINGNLSSKFKLVWIGGPLSDDDLKVEGSRIVDFEDINPIFERYLKANDLEPLN